MLHCVGTHTACIIARDARLYYRDRWDMSCAKHHHHHHQWRKLSYFTAHGRHFRENLVRNMVHTILYKCCLVYSRHCKKLFCWSSSRVKSRVSSRLVYRREHGKAHATSDLLHESWSPVFARSALVTGKKGTPSDIGIGSFFSTSNSLLLILLCAAVHSP